MQKIDPAFLFEIGDLAKSVRRIVERQDHFVSYFNLKNTVDAITTCSYQSIYREHFHTPLFQAANTVTELAQEYMALLASQEGEGEGLDFWQIKHINDAYTKFETILISELQSISSYIVTRKAGFDITSMVDAGRVFFSTELEAKVPHAIPDIEQAMRCIAFEVPTAAGFHLHRANETVLRVYWDNVTDGQERPKHNNMGAYLQNLDRLDKGNKSVRAHLQSIKDFHRNPLMHPDQSFETVEEAIDLMAAIRCAIGYMLKEIPAPIPIVIPAQIEAPEQTNISN
jgi:hypothetical protein